MIIGKELDQPVHNLLGGKFHDGLRILHSYTPTRCREQFLLQIDPERAPKFAALYAAGFTAIKLDPALPLLWNDLRQLSCSPENAAGRETPGGRQRVYSSTARTGK